MTEDQIQRSIVAYCAAVLDDGWRCVAVPNAAIRTKGGKAGNFCPGLARGFPDLLLIGQGRVCAMEVKTSKGTLSDFQKQWATWFTNAGATPWALVRSVDDVRACLTVWNIPTRNHRIS